MTLKLLLLILENIKILNIVINLLGISLLEILKLLLILEYGLLPVKDLNAGLLCQ